MSEFIFDTPHKKRASSRTEYKPENEPRKKKVDSANHGEESADIDLSEIDEALDESILEQKRALSPEELARIRQVGHDFYTAALFTQMQDDKESRPELVDALEGIHSRVLF